MCSENSTKNVWRRNWRQNDEREKWQWGETQWRCKKHEIPEVTKKKDSDSHRPTQTWKVQWQQRNQCWRHQKMRRRDKEMIRQIFNEVLNKNDCTPETWRRIRIKVIHKKETCRMLVMSVQFVFCLPGTNCSPHCCTPGFTQSLTFVSQLTKEDADAHIKLWITWWCTECWSNTAENGVFPMFISTIDFTKTFDRVMLECVETLWNWPEVHRLPDKNLHWPEDDSLDRQREWRLRDTTWDKTGRPVEQPSFQCRVTVRVGRWLDEKAENPTEAFF